MSWWRKRVTFGKPINLCPVILQARAILGIPDTSTKRKSEWQVISSDNKTALADPDIAPRLFLECEVANNTWGDVKTIIFDIENHKAYRNVTGTSYASGKCVSKQYLKSVSEDQAYYKPSEITNYQFVLDRILGNTENLS